MVKKRREIINECYSEKKALLLDVITLIDEIADGKSEASVCREHGIDKTRFRRLLRGNYLNKLFESNPKHSNVIPLDLNNWEEDFLKDLLKSNVVPRSDFEVVYEKYTKMFLTEREIDILECLYRKNQTLEETSRKYNIHRERVRQIKVAALNKLNRFTVRNAFLYGMQYEDDMVKYESEIYATNETLRRLDRKLKKLQNEVDEKENLIEEYSKSQKSKNADSFISEEK